MNSLLHTPEGVRDLYQGDCARKLYIEQKMHDVIKSYGYSDIEAPSFEYFDIFNKERGSVASKEMFKFFDREGNTMVLRPDMTPQIARIAAKYFENEPSPIKLCYQGKKFINGSSYQGRLKETTELGAELIGDASIGADAESVAMLVESLLAAGLKEFQVEIGHIAFFRGLVKEAGLNQEAEDELLEMIKNKNYFGIEEIIKNHHMDQKLGEAFLGLPQLFGSVDILDKAEKLTDNDVALNAIAHLKKLHHVLELYGVEKYVTYDLGMVNKLRYYTGIVFQAFTYGTGEYIASGGRYDKLIRQFGADKPSIGFSITVDYLLIALDRQKIALNTEAKESYLVVYAEESMKNAILEAKKLREQGATVSMVMMKPGENSEDYEEYVSKNHFTKIVEIKEN